MNFDRIIQMVMRQLVRRATNSGINMAAKKMSGKKRAAPKGEHKDNNA